MTFSRITRKSRVGSLSLIDIGNHSAERNSSLIGEANRRPGSGQPDYTPER